MTDTHITDPSIIEDDITIEKTLRPSHFDDFVGQNDVVDNLKLYIDAANKRDEATRLGNLTSPLRDRFGVILRVNYYTPKDLFKIINRSAQILEVIIDEDGAKELAKRSRGTPRIANRILRRTRDYADVKSNGKINKDIAQESLKSLGIDNYGLDDMDRQILTVLIDNFNGGPVGVGSLAVAISEDPTTIEDVYEGQN